MELLIVTPFFPPNGGPQALQSFRLARVFCESGAKVTVLAAGAPPLEPGNSHLENTLEYANNNLKVIRFSSPYWAKILAKLCPQLYRFFRPYDSWLYLPGLQAQLSRILKSKGFDAVISVAEPLASHAAVLNCLSRFGSKVKRIYWFSDPAPLVECKELMKFAWRRRIVEKMIRACSLDALYVIGVTDEIINPIKALAAGAPTFQVIPHCFDERDWPWPPKRSSSQTIGGNQISILHSGALYWKRRPFMLLEGVSAFATRTGLVGTTSLRLQGSIAPEIASELSRRQYPIPVRIDGSQSFVDAKQAMVEADVLCVIDADLANNVHLPSKVADYVGACRPILYVGNADSPTCRLLRDIHPAFTQANDPSGIASALDRLNRRRHSLNDQDYEPSYRLLSSENVYRDFIQCLSVQDSVGVKL